MAALAGSILRTMRPPRPIHPDHEKIFAFLLQVNKAKEVNATLRVAGGWVRDLIIGVPSDDIDIAVEGPGGSFMTGTELANKVYDYQKEHGMVLHSIGVIKTNPDKSKHLETATVTVFENKVEMCHLRTDDYSSDSRIPIVRPATVAEDAHRRDFTVNALYYNLHTQLIEDYTGGLDDMDKRVLNCPLNPSETFHDDPLRVLRAVRFGGKLGFQLSDDIKKSITPDVVDALHYKVSRERFGIEVEKMMKGPDPIRCFNLLYELKLIRLVFREVTVQRNTVVDDVLLPGSEEIVLFGIKVSEGVLQANINLPVNSDTRACASFAGFLTEVFLARHITSFTTEHHRVESIITHGLKLPMRTTNTVTRVMQAVNMMSASLHDAVAAPSVDMVAYINSTKGRVGVFEALRMLKPDAPEMFQVACVIGCIMGTRDVRVGIKHAHALLQAVESDPHDLKNAGKMAPLIKGDQLFRVLPCEKKHLSNALRAQLEYMVLHPGCATEEVLQHLKEHTAEWDFPTPPRSPQAPPAPAS